MTIATDKPGTATLDATGSALSAASSTPKPKSTPTTTTVQQTELDFSEHAPNLERVTSRIAGAIVEFCRERVGDDFHADDMRRHVALTVGPVAPASPDRVLRELRKRKRLNYRVVSRRQSIYQVLEVA